MATPRKLDWGTILLLLTMYGVLIGNLALYRSAPLHLPFHILLSTLAIHLSFTIWHEAVHRNVSNKTWINNVVGVLGMFPYMTPYFMQKWVHLEHHKHLNEREDPNVIYTDGSFRTLPLRYPRALGYARQLIRRDPRSSGQRLSDLAGLGSLAAIWATAFWLGMLWELVLLWFIPLVFAKLIMDWYINYLPHVGLPADRFQGTRIVDLPWLTPLVLTHNYHAIHHLWPSIPWHRYYATFRDRTDYLREHGVPIEHSIIPKRRVELEQNDSIAG